MDNPISIELNSEGNSMNSLSLLWIAEFKDKVLFQSNSSFQQVLDNSDNLEFFHLHNKDFSIHFIVNLKKGIIQYNETDDLEFQGIKENIRLIYFRRHRVEIGEVDLKEKNHTVKYHLGFQYNDKLGNNRRIVLIIDNQGNWTLGD